VDLNQYVILPQLRVWHFASPQAILASIPIDDECLHHSFFLLSEAMLNGLRVSYSSFVLNNMLECRIHFVRL